MENKLMSPDRQLAVKMMQNMGWTATQHPRGLWKFIRPDTGGLWDTMNINKSVLSPMWVADVAMRYGDAPELVAEIHQAQRDWLVRRFKGLMPEATQ